MHKITFQDWDKTNGNPFSSEHGTKVYVDGVLIGERIDVNQFDLSKILEALKVEFEIEDLEHNEQA